MKLWVDDVREPPEGYIHRRSVNSAKAYIEHCEANWLRYPMLNIELIDVDHDAGDYANDGGDYIKLIDWLEETGRNYPIRIHSMNSVGRENMRVIIRRNGWKEIR